MNKKHKKDKEKSENTNEKPPQQFTPLTVPLGEVDAQMDPNQFPEPRKMKTSESKRDTSKYCRYYKDHRHETDSCWKLKEEIEKLIQRGQL